MKKYELGMYEKAVPNEFGWKEKLEAAREAGYDFVEISIDETDARLSRLDMTSKELQDFFNLQAACSMPVRSMCLSAHRKYPLGSRDTLTAQKSLDIMKKAVDFSAALGIRVIMLAGYDVYYEESDESTVRRFEQNLAASVEFAARAGVLLAFETMETPFMDTVEKAMKYVRQINSPYLNVYPDLGNITNAAMLYKTDVAADLSTGAGHLVGVHIKETVPGKYREIPFGTGHVEFKRLLQTAWNLNVRRYVTELWKTGDDWQPRLREAAGIFSKILDEISGAAE